MRYAKPGAPDSVVDVSPRYDNFIGGKWLAPKAGEYMPNHTPVTGELICEVATRCMDSCDASRNRNIVSTTFSSSETL